MWNFLKGKKTYLLSFAGIVYAISGAITGHITWKEAIDLLWASGVAFSLRNAISNE